MKTISVEYVEQCLRRNCVVSPITVPKIKRVFENNPDQMDEALELYAQGLLDGYHMLPHNKTLKF